MEAVRSKDGTTLAFDRVGDGPALILVGGATTMRSDQISLAEKLAPNFSVFSYNRRGRGESGDTAPYAVEREIEDLEAMIVQAGGSTLVFGHSSGAVLALRAAASGLAITKLAIYEPPFVVDDSRPPLPDNYVTQLSDLVSVGRRGDALRYFFMVGVAIPAEYLSQMEEDPTWAASEAVAHTLVYDGLVMGKTMMGRPLTQEPWGKITVPTLVLDGSASPDWQRHGVQGLVGVLPNAQHATLAGQGHGPADEVLVPVLLEFLQS